MSIKVCGLCKHWKQSLIEDNLGITHDGCAKIRGVKISRDIACSEYEQGFPSLNPDSYSKVVTVKSVEAMEVPQPGLQQYYKLSLSCGHHYESSVGGLFIVGGRVRCYYCKPGGTLG